MIPCPNWDENCRPTYKAFFDNDLRPSFWFDLTVSVAYDSPLNRRPSFVTVECQAPEGYFTSNRT